MITALLFYGLVFMINKNIESFSENINHYEDRIKKISDDLSDFLMISNSTPKSTDNAGLKSQGVEDIFNDSSLRDQLSSILNSVSKIITNFL